ncbi:hypothetical protein AB0D45_09670 [Streptomyces sp. NPDC048352]|uniref:hypothetical protein n=1 Tax=Streptomyces sp. NPDC048352 TaxID=3154718 RepID=UPI00343BB7F5
MFQTGGDAVHYSSTPPPTISAHGWWLDKDSGGAKAKVTVEIQILTGGRWHTARRPNHRGRGPRDSPSPRRGLVGVHAGRDRTGQRADPVGDDEHQDEQSEEARQGCWRSPAPPGGTRSTGSLPLSGHRRS